MGIRNPELVTRIAERIGFLSLKKGISTARWIVLRVGPAAERIQIADPIGDERFAIKMHAASTRDWRRRRGCDEAWVEGCAHMDKHLRKYAICPAERVASAFKIRLFCAW